MRRVSAILTALLLGAVVFAIALCVQRLASRRDPTNLSPAETFQALIADPVPAAVRDLQGGGLTWQGYSISLRFRAPSLESAGFSQPPYSEVDCAQLESRMKTNAFDPSPFVPEWKIPETGTPTCLEWRELSNAWTTLGDHRVLYVDGWVFFVGGGS